MAIRDFDNLSYVPLLSVRPAELRALQELPERDKSRLLPYFFLRPWASALQLDAALKKIEDAYGDRPIIMDLAAAEPADTPRPVHEQLNRLRDPTDGYANWCAFIRAHRSFIPSLQLGDPRQFQRQTDQLLDEERGLAVRFPRAAFGGVRLYAERLGAVTGGGAEVCIILDYGRGSRDLLLQQASTVSFVRSILEVMPRAAVGIAASSFPDGFVGLTEQQIYERELFNAVRLQVGGDRLVYSDRGSVRAERQLGGGGTPAPRIDYAMPIIWHFYRADDPEDRPRAYRRLAQNAIASPLWDRNLRLWGTQMIERTAIGDPEAIVSPARSTAARINIHLHRQLYYDAPAEGSDTDEEWTD